MAAFKCANSRRVRRVYYLAYNIRRIWRIYTHLHGSFHVLTLLF